MRGGKFSFKKIYEMSNSATVDSESLLREN